MNTNLNSITPVESPFWCFNSHVHTIACSLLSKASQSPGKRIEINTPDNDFLELDVIDKENDSPVIALFHGLEGSTDRYYMVELMNKLSGAGLSTVGVNFRSCGSRLNDKRRFYHSGETKDYQTVFRWIKKTFPNKPIGAVGFSLGANALLKSLGEEGDSHPVDTTVAVSVPYDLKAGSLIISEGFNQIYEYRFLRTLRKKLAEKRKKYPDLPRFTGSSLYEFDDQVTAKIHGFKDAEDYYEKCSSRRFISTIRRPTLLIHSREDPLCPIERMPMSKIKRNNFLKYIVTKEGGHVGFWHKSIDWLNQTILHYLQSYLPR